MPPGSISGVGKAKLERYGEAFLRELKRSAVPRTSADHDDGAGE